MTGQNGHTNGDSNGTSGGNSTWMIGLVNSALKYLTAETFGFKVNANGVALKKKQLWTMEPFGDQTDAICLKSHLDKYLSVDQVTRAPVTRHLNILLILFFFIFFFVFQYGNVTCDSDEKDNGARLEIVVPEKNRGRWALRHPGRGYFLGAASDKLICTAKTPTENELW